jgi:DNA-binding NtrC family response regulator
MEPYVVTVAAIDDDAGSLDFIKAALKQHPVEVLTATDADAGLELVLRRRPEVVLLDLLMPKMNGLEVLDRIVDAAPETEVILITGHYSAESAVEAIRRGASDYITKPISVNLLRDRIGKLVREAQQRQAALQLDDELLKTHQFEGMIGRSPNPAGCAPLPDGSRNGGERDGKGIGGCGAASAQSGGGQPVCSLQLFGSGRDTL